MAAYHALLDDLADCTVAALNDGVSFVIYFPIGDNLLTVAPAATSTFLCSRHIITIVSREGLPLPS